MSDAWCLISCLISLLWHSLADWRHNVLSEKNGSAQWFLLIFTILSKCSTAEVIVEYISTVSPWFWSLGCPWALKQPCSVYAATSRSLSKQRGSESISVRGKHPEESKTQRMVNRPGTEPLPPERWTPGSRDCGLSSRLCPHNCSRFPEEGCDGGQ